MLDDCATAVGSSPPTTAGGSRHDPSRRRSREKTQRRVITPLPTTTSATPSSATGTNARTTGTSRPSTSPGSSKRQGHSPALITKALDKLDKAAALGGSKTLYDANREVYGLLRYGARVSPGVGKHTVTVHLIDWKNPAANHFAIAEEVTVTGKNTKRPDIVLYVNGIAIGVLELKRSTVSVAQGIRQNLDSQKKDFIQPFFSTVQLVMAGNDTEGLRYGVIETPEKYWLRWKEADAPETTPPPPPSSPNSATSAPPTACSNSSTTSWSSTPASRRSAGTTSTSG